MHVLPRAAELEKRFGDALVVIGVHAGKFAEERKTANIREACSRLGVRHPVVNDRHYRVWRSYSVSAWPTVALVSPDGYLVQTQAGEFEVERMAETVGRLAERYEGDGLLRRDPPDFGADPAALPEPSGELRYPTRVVASGERVYVSDSGHHRVVELRLEGPAEASVLRIFGDGEDGFLDGPPSVARFSEPQGLALGAKVLYVADRRNHAIRAVSLEDGRVTTIAGSGELGGYRIAEERPGRETELRSPWGLALDGEALYVAMAGSHQIWAADLSSPEHRLSLAAGSGGENISDGRSRSATLAQTSGLVIGDRRLYFADSESSAVRWMRRGEVGTIVGTGLFDFGDRDGLGDEALLQHDLDLTMHDGKLLVADTYNSKLKVVDPQTRRCETLPGDAGSGEALYEPGGVWAGPEGVFVADTNHHRITRVDPVTGALTPIAVKALSSVPGD
ncbi:MAG TPA: alkyl hydroperoxide reductase [Coriobacteriia bacterium]|jgi:DNA-binding beta-propeller fold protein YncE